MTIVAKARFSIPPKMKTSTTIGELCSRCPMLPECKECALDGRVLACEAADERDAKGLRLQ